MSEQRLVFDNWNVVLNEIENYAYSMTFQFLLIYLHSKELEIAGLFHFFLHRPECMWWIVELLLFLNLILKFQVWEVWSSRCICFYGSSTTWCSFYTERKVGICTFFFAFFFSCMSRKFVLSKSKCVPQMLSVVIHCRKKSVFFF